MFVEGTARCASQRPQVASVCMRAGKVKRVLCWKCWKKRKQHRRGVELSAWLWLFQIPSLSHTHPHSCSGSVGALHAPRGQPKHNHLAFSSSWAAACAALRNLIRDLCITIAPFLRAWPAGNAKPGGHRLTQGTDSDALRGNHLFRSPPPTDQLVATGRGLASNVLFLRISVP